MTEQERLIGRVLSGAGMTSGTRSFGSADIVMLEELMSQSAQVTRGGEHGVGFFTSGGGEGVVAPSGCFSISGWEEKEEEHEGETSVVRCPIIINRWYRIGGTTYIMPDDEKPPMQESWAGCILGIRIDTNSSPLRADFEVWAGVDDMKRGELRIFDTYVLPLYKFGSDGNVEIDLRTMQVAQMTEV